MASSGDPDRSNFKAGLFTIVSIALGFATIVVLNGKAIEQLFGSYNRYQVRFDLVDGVAGLDAGAEVRVGGLTRGAVRSIALVGLDATGGPPEAVVEIEIDRDIRLWSNAVAIRTIPVLGGSSWINITTIGGSDQVTISPTGDNGDGATLLPTDGTGEIPATPGDGLLTTIVGPENATSTRQLLYNMAEFSEFLDRDVVATFDDEIRPAVADARLLVGEVRSDYGGWRTDIDRTFESVSTAAGDLEGTMDTARRTIDEVRGDVRLIGDLVRRNVGRIDASIANVEIMSEDGAAITRRLRDDTLARVDEALDSGAEAIGDLAQMLRTLDLEVTAAVPSIRSFLQDAMVAAGELKLATIEIRRSPWRILYQPQPGELANENLFAAARDFTIASGEVRSAAESLQAVMQRFPAALEQDPTLREDVERFLGESLRRLETAQSRLFSVIIGDGETEAPQPDVEPDGP
ncbi:MAG: hypothetical protein VX726_06725 [Planctomycetota bacterium]|nr:hypothetical protein [Planctomycetota bacterium]